MTIIECSTHISPLKAIKSNLTIKYYTDNYAEYLKNRKQRQSRIKKYKRGRTLYENEPQLINILFSLSIDA